AQMERNGASILNSQQIETLTRKAFTPGSDGKLHVNKDYVGRDASVLGQAAGTSVPPSTQLLVGETRADHLFVQEEQMMPFVPFVRVRDVNEAIELGLEAEDGYGLRAIIHSRT